MNKFDETYLNLLKDVINNGTKKNTRSGEVISLFGKQMKFDLKKGFPLLTTKKVFIKGIVHELLWFLKYSCTSHQSANIHYLLKNDVHIWDLDAFRWYKQYVKENVYDWWDKGEMRITFRHVKSDEEHMYKEAKYSDKERPLDNPIEFLTSVDTIEKFASLVLDRMELRIIYPETISKAEKELVYRFGDLGPVYGYEWRRHNGNVDQLMDIIDKLKNRPDDRRMLCLAYNPSTVRKCALPPCHVMMQFYTRKLDDGNRGLSCMFTMRSNDLPCGSPFNIASYALLTYMIAHIVGMVPDELTCSIGDAHIYLNQMDGVNEQLSRNGSDVYPQLEIRRDVHSIDDFEFDDFELINYNPEPPIKFPLSVG